MEAPTPPSSPPGPIVPGLRISTIPRNNSSKKQVGRPKANTKKRGPRPAGNKQNRATEAVFSNPRTFAAPRAKAARIASDTRSSISKCAMKYALAISSPFNPEARGACLPVFPSPPSHKVTAFTRFNITIGTAGVGFLAAAPCLSNDGICAYYSTSAYTQSDIKVLSANNTLFTGVATASFGGIPYTTAQYTTGLANNEEVVAGRCVSYGARATYTGTTLNESGVAYVYASPTHGNAVFEAGNAPKAGALAECEVCGITRRPCESFLYPVTSGETCYGNDASASVNATTGVVYPYNGGSEFTNGFSNLVNTAYVGSPSLVIFVTGVVGSTFLVEIVQHSEHVGAATAAMVTPSDADQRGFEMVTAAAERIPQIKMANPQLTPLQCMYKGMSAVANALKPVALKMLVAGGNGLISGLSAMVL